MGAIKTWVECSARALPGGGARAEFGFDPSQALDCLAHGVIIADSGSRPLFVNRTAGEILNEADGLQIDPTGLATAFRSETAMLRAAVAAMSDETPGHASGALTITRPSMRRPLAAIVLPASRAGGFDAGCKKALLFLRDPERSDEPPLMLLQRLYGLTAAEAEVAVEIARGEGVPSVAKKLGISHPTVRTHLQRIFGKTGTCKQAQLAWLLAETCGLLRFGCARSPDGGVMPSAGFAHRVELCAAQSTS
jgi:DNA-binding CsgD family transcriptional regulator